MDDDAFDAMMRRIRPAPPPPPVVDVHSNASMPRVRGSVLEWLFGEYSRTKALGGALHGVLIHPEDVKKLGEEYRACARSRY